MKIQINCETSGANIYYTLDGSTPTKDKSLYTNELELSESCTVKAVGVKEGFKDSEITEQNFEVLQKLPTPDIRQFTDRTQKLWGFELNNLVDYPSTTHFLIWEEGASESDIPYDEAMDGILVDYINPQQPPSIGNTFNCQAGSIRYADSEVATITIKKLSECIIRD